MTNATGVAYTKQIRNVKFWKSEKGFFLSHTRGLTTDQVAFLQSLQPGEKLIIFAEKDDVGRDVLTMKKSNIIATTDEQPKQ
jgi:hypothetical protein